MYSAIEDTAQLNFNDPRYPQPEEEIEILDGNCLSPVKEVLAFSRRLDDRLTFSELRAQICLDYDLGCVDAVTTLKRLYDNGLVQDPDHLVTTYSAGVRALAEGERT